MKCLRIVSQKNEGRPWCRAFVSCHTGYVVSVSVRRPARVLQRLHVHRGLRARPHEHHDRPC